MRTLFFIAIISFLNIQAQNVNQFDEQGRRHGLWKGYFEKSKNLRYEGEFKHGIEIGEFKFYEDTKSKRLMATRNFSRDTLGKVHTIFYNQKYKVSEGFEMNKKREGAWVYYHNKSSKIMMRENYRNGELEGPKLVYFHNDKIAEESFYKNGKLHGSYKKFAHNGVVLEESNYENGYKHGVFVIRDGNGKVAIEGQYKHDKSSGVWKYYQNGKFEKEVNKDNPSLQRLKNNGKN